jgi:TRAP-type C4-dicarboxylate transport system substrate-binding protein/TRAP-type C4-dicarboxylate transport system permease small subunit
MKKLILSIVALVLSAPAMAVTLKIATVTPNGSQWMADMKAGAAEVKERTEGRVQIKFYGGGVKGDDAKVLGQIRIRQLQGGAFTPSALAAQYSDLNLYGMPLVFDSEEEAAFVRSRMDARLSAGLEEAGFVNFGFATSGFANIMSATPVRTLADLKGKRVWVPEGDNISAQSLKALSLNPVTLPLTDVLTGLQTGLIDIVAIPPIVALIMQWHTKVKYVTQVPFVYTLGFMAIDKKTFDKISDEDQNIIREVMTKTYQNFDKMNVIDNDAAFDSLIKSGIENVDFDRAEFNKVREILLASNRKIGLGGAFTLELYCGRRVTFRVGLKQILEKLDRAGTALETVMLVSLLTMMMLVAVGQIIMREAFGTGFVWADELVRLMVLWLAMVGSIAACRENRHIRIDALSHVFPDRVVLFIRVFVDLFAAIVCAVIATQAWRYLQIEIEYEDTVLIDTPAWIAHVIMPLAFALIAYRFFVAVGRQTIELFFGPAVEAEE